HPAEDPGRPAGGDGRAAGLGGRAAAHAAGTVHGDRHPEPGRVRRHLPAAGSPARPVPAQAAAAAAGTVAGDRGAPAALAGLRPARPRRRRRLAGGRPRGSGGRPGGGQARAGGPRGARLRGRHRARHTHLALALTRGLAARGDGAAGHGAGVGVAVRPRLCHPGRRQGAGPSDAAAPRPAPRRGRTGRRDRGDRARRRPRVRAGPPLMVPTTRAAVVMAVGAVPAALWPRASTLWLWIGLVVLACVVDTVLAASPKQVRPERSVPGSVRLGEPTSSTLTLTNTGARRLRAVVRDAWPPSAGAEHNRHRVRIPPGERRRVRTPLRPTRRGDRPADLVTIRSVGPLGMAARQRSLPAPATLRVLP